MALLASGSAAVAAGAVELGVTVPGVGSVDVTAPTVTAPTVTAPTVTAPTVTVPALPAPPPVTAPAPSSTVSAPAAPAPSLSVATTPTPAGAAVVAPSPAGAVSPVRETAGGVAAEAGTGPGGGASTAPGAGSHDDSSAAAGPGRAGRPGVAREHPSAGARVSGDRAERRLERTVTRARQCLDELGAGERRVLTLRAGIGPGTPLTRLQVAHRLGLGLARTGRLERRGLRRLDALDRAGACGGGGVVAGAGAAPTLGAGARGGRPQLSADNARALRPRFAVGGVSAHGDGGGHRSGLGALPPPIGSGGEATLLVALGLLVALALLVRRELQRR